MFDIPACGVENSLAKEGYNGERPLLGYPEVTLRPLGTANMQQSGSRDFLLVF
jgi:hypothetical protein